MASTFAEGLNDPMGLCWNGGVLYVAEAGASRIIKIENGQSLVVAGSGAAGLLVQGKTLYVCDSFSGKILVLTLR